MCVCVCVCLCVCLGGMNHIFYNSAISKHVIRARIKVEMGSHPTKRFLFNHTTPFLTKGLEKSLCDFTGTFFVWCENPVISYFGQTDNTACGLNVARHVFCMRLILPCSVCSERTKEILIGNFWSEHFSSTQQKLVFLNSSASVSDLNSAMWNI